MLHLSSEYHFRNLSQLRVRGSLWTSLLLTTTPCTTSIEEGWICFWVETTDNFRCSMSGSLSSKMNLYASLTAKASRAPNYLTECLEARHIAICIFDGIQTLPDRRSAQTGLRRRIAFSVPCFSVAVQAVAGTNLIVTVPKRMAILEGRNTAPRFVKAPKPFSKFVFHMWWHQRMNNDVAHIWLRNTVQEVANSL